MNLVLLCSTYVVVSSVAIILLVKREREREREREKERERERERESWLLYFYCLLMVCYR